MMTDAKCIQLRQSNDKYTQQLEIYYENGETWIVFEFERPGFSFKERPLTFKWKVDTTHAKFPEFYDRIYDLIFNTDGYDYQWTREIDEIAECEEWHGLITY